MVEDGTFIYVNTPHTIILKGMASGRHSASAPLVRRRRAESKIT